MTRTEAFDFGFRIFDFGLKDGTPDRAANPKSKIENPKSSDA